MPVCVAYRIKGDRRFPRAPPVDVNSGAKEVIDVSARHVVDVKLYKLVRHFALLLSAHTHKKPSEYSELDVFQL